MVSRPAMLRIGELAELAGVTTRTIRHYHRIGLLAEPGRQDNGYRAYQLRDAVRLLRVRRLVELGLSLDEVADALADDEGRELREILAGLEADLAEQEARIAARRERITQLLAREGDLVMPEAQAAVLGELERAAGPDHPGLDREHLVLELIEPAVGPALAPGAWQTYERVLGEPDLSGAMLEASRRFEDLAGRDVDDPAVEALAREGAGFGEALLDLLPDEIRGQPGDPESAGALLRTVAAGMGPAQARCLELMFGYWREQSS